MALNKNINEAYPAFVGGGNAVQNGKTNTQPSSDMVSPQNIENSTLGGSEAVVSDTRHLFDFVNGKGDYGVFGRDFSYSISSLALVNPYAAGAVVGVLGAGSLIYGIMTSAYVRSKQTLRRLRKLYRGVVGSGYRVDNMNSFYTGIIFNAISAIHYRKRGYNKVGVNQFYKEIEDTISGIMEVARGLKLDAPALIENLTPGEYKKKRSGINHILSTSYAEFYIPSAEVTDASKRYKDILKSNRFKYDKNMEESYDKLMKRMQDSTVNAPLYKRRDDYVAKINELGESLVGAFDTKMGYALKRGGNRAISCSKKLHATWKGMMDDIKKKIDGKLDVIVQELDASSNTTEAQKVRDIIEAMYKKNALPLTIESVQDQLYVGALFMRRSSVAKDGNPEMVKICSFNADDWDNGLVRIKLVNSDIAGTGKYTKVPITKLYDETSMPEKVEMRDDNSGKGRNNDRYIRLGEYAFKGTVQEGRWYKVNYIASTGGTAGANGMWTAVVYVVGIVTAGAYGAPGAKYVQYRYVNFPTYVGKKGGGTLQQEPLDSFTAWVVSEIKEFNHINKIVESADYNTTDYLFEDSADDSDDIAIINPNPAAKYEPWRRDRTRGKSNSSNSNNSNNTSANNSSNNSSSRSFADEDDGVYVDSLSDCKIDCTSFAFARKGAYILYASKNREIVYTEDITPGKVRTYNAYENKKEFSWEEWEKLIPVQVPFVRNPYGDPDIADILLDDDIEDINNGDDYPLTYGTFEKTYMQRKFEMQYNSVFSKYDASLREIDITLDVSGKRCFGLCKADGYYGKNTLRDPENFKRYLRECISDEILIKDEAEMNSILGNNKSSNESLSIKGIKRLFESGVLFEDSPVQNNAKVEDNSMKQNTTVVTSDVSVNADGSKNDSAQAAADGTVQTGRDNNGKVENVRGDKTEYKFENCIVYIQDGKPVKAGPLVERQQETGKVGQDPEKTVDDIKKKGEKAKGQGGSEDVSTNDDNKKQIVPIDGIPDIVRKVCIDILRKVKAFAKQFGDGNDRTKFNNPPRVFRGRTDQIVHLLIWRDSKLKELGVDTRGDISKHDFSKDVVSSLATSKWYEKYIVSKEYKYKWEPVFYYKKEEVVPKHKPDEIYIDTDDSGEGEEKRVMTYTFFIRDMFVEVTDIDKFDETFTLTADGVYMKGSDQELKKDLDNANVSLGGYYLLPSDVFKSLHEKEENSEEKTSNESFDYSDKEFYKIFEDDNNVSTEDDEIHLDTDDSDTETSSTNNDAQSSNTGKDVLVLVNSVKEGKVEFKYIKDSSLITDYVSVDKTAKVDMSKYVYEYATDDKMKIQYYSVYQLSKEGYDFIANAGFVKDRSSVSMYANNTVLVIPTLPITTPTIEPMKVGVIDFIIGNTATEPLTVLYEYALMHDFDNALTYVEWMSNVSYGVFKTGDAPQYYKMSKDEFDKSFGLLIKQEESDNKEHVDNSEDSKEESTAPQSQVNSGYYYDVDYFYKLYEADDNSTTGDNGGSEEQTNTEDSSANVKEVYIELNPVSGSYKSMDSTTMLGAKFIAKCKTDVQLKDGGEAKETTEFSFNEQKLRTDIKIERLDDMPEGWDKKAEDNKGEEKKDDNKEVKYEPYPDRGISPFDKNSYDGMETLKEWVTTIDLENNGSKLDSYSKGMMLDFIVSTFKREVNEGSRFDDLGSIMKSLIAKGAEPNPNRFDNDINAKKYDVMYDFVNFIIDMFLAKGWDGNIAVNDERPQWLHYINTEGKEVRHEVKVENVTDSSIYILYKDEDEGDKHYILPKSGNEYMIIESAFGFATIRFKSHDMYMKHVLYNIPLNEALIVDFGGMDSFKSILDMLVNDDDSLYSIMSWASSAYKNLVERYNKIHANDGNATQSQQSQPAQPQSPAQNAPQAQSKAQAQPKPHAQPKPAPAAPQGTNPTVTGGVPTWTTTSTADA